MLKIASKNGIVAEWLGIALQRLIQWFESTRCLNQKPPCNKEVFDFWAIP